MGELIATGDEPRYIYGGLEPWLPNGERAINSLESWVRHQGFDWLSVEPYKGPHSVLHMWIISPVLRFGGLSSARWLVAIVALSSITYFVFRYESAFSKEKAFAVTTMTLSMPIFPYLRLLYSEIWGCFIIAVLLVLVSKQSLSRLQWISSAILVTSLPFIHIRFAPPAIILAAVFLWKWWMASERKRAFSVMVQIIFSLAILQLFRLYQNVMSDGNTSSIPAVKPNFGSALERSAIHLMSYRHGLLLFNPLILLGFAGFILAIREKHRLTVIAGCVFCATFLGFIWGSGLESFPGRFWVAATPSLIVGVAYWFKQAGSLSKWIFTMPLLLVSLLNTFIMVMHPGEHLSNRYGLLSYDRLFHLVGRSVHPGLIAIVDPFESGLKFQNFRNHPLIIVFAVVIFSIALAAVASKSKASRFAGAFLCFASFLCVADAMRTNPLPIDRATVETGIDSAGHSFLEVSFKTPTSIDGFKLGDYADWPLWGMDPAAPKEFLISGLNKSNEAIPPQSLPGFQMEKIRYSEPLKVLRMTSLSDSSDLRWTTLKLALFQR